MLFKYLPIERIDALEKLKIRFSPLQSLNDPYESMPSFNIEDLVEAVVKNNNQQLDEIWEKTPDVEKTSENKILLYKEKYNLEQNTRKSLTSEAIKDNLINLFGDTYGVLSLSRSNKSLLMWSHYASSHCGFVIGFDENNDFFHQSTIEGKVTNPYSVKYSDQKITVDLDAENMIEKILCHKSLEWSYEQEERVFRGFMNNQNSTGALDNFGNDIILHDIPPEAILAVYIGARATKETENRIKKAVIVHNLRCKVLKSRIANHEYRIEFYDNP